ncbi:unnamed protein product [Orchesella dallaii]|uniref:Uncharacterized protein n=1 Tax=Orchesella dallaii TaxID=48710 RepID=A0ABP1RBA1_9HEXA
MIIMNSSIRRRDKKEAPHSQPENYPPDQINVLNERINDSTPSINPTLFQKVMSNQSNETSDSASPSCVSSGVVIGKTGIQVTMPMEENMKPPPPQSQLQSHPQRLPSPHLCSVSNSFPNLYPDPFRHPELDLLDLDPPSPAPGEPENWSHYGHYLQQLAAYNSTGIETAHASSTSSSFSSTKPSKKISRNSSSTSSSARSLGKELKIIVKPCSTSAPRSRSTPTTTSSSSRSTSKKGRSKETTTKKVEQRRARWRAAYQRRKAKGFKAKRTPISEDQKEAKRAQWRASYQKRREKIAAEKEAEKEKALEDAIKLEQKRARWREAHRRRKEAKLAEASQSSASSSSGGQSQAGQKKKVKVKKETPAPAISSDQEDSEEVASEEESSQGMRKSSKQKGSSSPQNTIEP